MKASNTQEDGGFIDLAEMGSRSIGRNKIYDHARNTKHKTWDGEPYICELKNHPDYDKYFNPKKDMIWS